ncbi:alpha/beta fold hydrolase [Microbacterium sp.]|uniref:alpha/beta fold hydrolase n=1 Tax=Microbacterium sp. TaxID=51671 RepID=UPI003F6F96F8
MTRRDFTHAGATLVAESHGTGRPIFVMIHGIGMGRSVFIELDEALRPGARTIAIDLPGYGEAPEPRRTLTMERTADLVSAYLRASVDEPVVVIGHSMGTQVATEVAVRHPSLVRRLVLIAPTVDPDARTAPRQIGRLLADIAVESPKVILRGAREYVRAGPRLRAKFRAMLVHRPEDSYPRIEAPTLVLRGENDIVSPHAWCERVIDLIPDARLVEIDGHGHETMIRDAAPAAAAIRSFVQS